MTRFAAVAAFDGPPDRALVDALSRETNVLWEGNGLVIAGDARLDGRSSGDLDAILDAYREQGERCVEQLHGAFAFAIHDPARQRLVCARDRFGLHPFYYAIVDGTLVVTNTLPALLAVVPDDLDETVMDHLFIHGLNVDPQRTAYRAIARLPPAHRLVATADGVRIERYWSFPLAGRPRVIRERDAVAELRHHLDAAVRDAARGRAVLSMSGGIDSTSVATSLRRNGIAAHAVTNVWDGLIPDEEGAAASIAARALGIPIELHGCGGYRLFERWEEPAIRGWEPRDEPLSIAFHELLRRAAVHGEVLFTGSGGDPALCTSKSYFFDLLKRGRWLRFAIDAVSYAATRRRRPPLVLRSRLFASRARNDPPPWLRADLRDRWYEPMPRLDARVHPWRPEAFAAVMSAGWPSVFESYDPGVTRQRIELAAPFFDVRLLEFLFSLPPMPFFAAKDIAREAMRGELPESIRRRPKRRLQGDPVEVLRSREIDRWIAIVEQTPRLDGFVDRRILRKELRRDVRTEGVASAVALGCWMRHYDEQRRQPHRFGS